MLKNKKLFGGLIIFSALFTLVPCIVNASAKTDEMIKKISPDGKTAVFKTVKPKDALDSQFLITSYVESIIGEKGYYTFAYCEAPYTKCTIDIQSEDLETS
ncbi:MAG: hypothetical protein PUD59_04340 [bacterium]|nr:hypothetical protein [bacterium]